MSKYYTLCITCHYMECFRQEPTFYVNPSCMCAPQNVLNKLADKQLSRQVMSLEITFWPYSYMIVYNGILYGISYNTLHF